MRIFKKTIQPSEMFQIGKAITKMAITDPKGLKVLLPKKRW